MYLISHESARAITVIISVTLYTLARRTELKHNLEVRETLDVRDMRTVMMLIEPAPTRHSVIIVAENPLQRANIVLRQSTQQLSTVYSISNQTTTTTVMRNGRPTNIINAQYSTVQKKYTESARTAMH